MCSSPVVQNAWDRGQALAIHGLAYRVSDGVLQVSPLLAAACGGYVELCDRPLFWICCLVLVLGYYMQCMMATIGLMYCDVKAGGCCR